MFSKEDYDVSRIFLAYLAFLGNATKVSIALKIPAEVVKVLAAKEDWETKLKTYMGMRHVQAIEGPDRAIRRSVNLIQARHLQDLIGHLLEHIRQSTDVKTLIGWLSPADAKTNRPKFNVRIVSDLAKAFFVATRIIYLASKEKDIETPEEARERGQRTFFEAMDRVTRGIDKFPGLDSVALTKKTLAIWESKEENV